MRRIPNLSACCSGRACPAGRPADEVNRTAHYQHKAQAYAAAQRAGLLDDDLDPDHLVFLIIALAAWWISAPQLARMLTGADDSEPAEHARRRASVVRAAERLARPRPLAGLGGTSLRKTRQTSRGTTSSAPPGPA